MNSIIPVSAIKGRGTATRLANRFENVARDEYDDGWGTLEDGAANGLPPPATTVSFEDARSVISHNSSPDIYFEQSLNPYRGCEHVMCPENLLLQVDGLRRFFYPAVTWSGGVEQPPCGCGTSQCSDSLRRGCWSKSRCFPALRGVS